MLLRRLVVLAALLGLAVAPAGAQPTPTTVHVGVLGNDDMIAVLWAQRTGMYQKAGLDVQIDKSSANGAAIAAAVVSGAYDIGKASAPAIIDAHLKGLPFVVIGTAAVYESKAPYVGFIVPKDAPIQSARDLTGGIVGLSFLKDGGQLSIMKALDEAGLTAKAPQFVEVPMSAAAPAVDQKRVVAAEISYPPAQAALDTGKFRMLPVYNALGDSYSFSVWFTTRDYVKKHPDVVKTFQRITAESARYTNAHHAETAPMAAEYTGIPLATIQKMPRVTNGTAITAAGLQPWIDAEAKMGFIPRRFGAQELLDPDLANEPR